MAKTPARKPTRAKPKPRAKPKAKATTRTKRKAPARLEPVAVVTRAPVVKPPSNGLAVAAIALSVAGFTFVPLIGGLAGAALGAVHLRKERERPDLYTGKSIATAAVVIGIITGVLPSLVLGLIAADDITPIPFVMAFVFAIFVFWTALHGRSTREKVAIFGGSLVATALAAVLSVLIAIGFYYLAVFIGREIGHAIGDAFSQMFDGIFDSLGDAFGSCN